MNNHIEMKQSNTHEQLLQDKVTDSRNSLTDTALPNMSPTHVSDIVAVTQSDDLELRGKVYKSYYTQRLCHYTQ